MAINYIHPANTKGTTDTKLSFLIPLSPLCPLPALGAGTSVFKNNSF